MIAVLLDASCLRREGLVSTAMLELTRLAENGRVVVVLSDIVVREHLSQHADELASQLDAAGKSLKAAARGLRVPDPPVHDLDRLGVEIAALEGRLRSSYEAAFEAWAHRCGARRITFDAGRIDDVINDYFAGSGAFSSRKSRKDFPDALILSSARTAAVDYDQFHMVAGDEHLRYAASGIGIVSHDTLIQFLESPSIREARERLAVEQQISDLSSRLLSVEYLDKIAEWLLADNNQIESVHLEHEDLLGLEEVGVTVFGATIDYPVPRAIKSVHISLASPSTADKWALSIGFETQCRLGFVTSWPESIELEGKREVSVESADEVVELTEAWWAYFDAEIIFDLAQWKQGSELEMPAIDSLSPELNITRATLLRPA